MGAVRYTIYTMEFEFDPNKSASNKHKHGIDLGIVTMIRPFFASEATATSFGPVPSAVHK